MHEVIAQFLGHAKAMWQHRWHAVLAAWMVCIVGWIAVLMLPDKFEATARVYVDTQSVLKPLLSGLAVQPNVDQQINMMSRTLISRPNLEKVVRMADLDIKARTAEEKESQIDRLSKAIEVKSAGRDNLYTISYSDRKPEDAKRVVQSLLTIFVEGSLGDKRKDADSARRFIDEQLKVYEQKLLNAENALKEFKRKNIGLMPNQDRGGQDYFARLADMQSKLSQASLELREAQDARDVLARQLSGEEPVLVQDETPSVSANPEMEQRLGQMRSQLDQLRQRFTDQHPDVVAAKRLIAQTEEQLKTEATAKKPLPKAAQPILQANPVQQQLRVSLAEAEAAVASLKVRAREYQSRYNELRSAANMVPQVEADFTQLNRDYEVNKANYEKLLARRESAQISGDMEANTSVMDFRIVDPPRAPLAPTFPNRPVFMSGVLVLGLLAGLAFALFMSLVRPTFADRKTLRDSTGLPVLGSISMMWTVEQKKRRRRSFLGLLTSLLALISSYGGLMAWLLLSARGAG